MAKILLDEKIEDECECPFSVIEFGIYNGYSCRLNPRRPCSCRKIGEKEFVFDNCPYCTAYGNGSELMEDGDYMSFDTKN